MRIAFILIGNSRRSNYLNGDTIRDGGGGGSGTDTSTILIAEYLALQGHEVVIATEKLEPLLEKTYAEKGKYFPKGEKVRGVQYTDINFNYVDNKVFDILVNSLWFDSYNTLPIKVTRGLIYWCHMQWIYGVDQIINYVKSNSLILGFVNISKWEREINSRAIHQISSQYGKVKTTLIPNSICDDVIKEVLSEQIQRKPHKFIFHASWARGGDVAIEVIKELEFLDKELHAFDYLDTISNHQYPYFYRHNGVDKRTLFKHLAESEYFVYPLYTPYQDVHKDTFSCVVAEAIALGAIPITYPLGALPENFNGYCKWIEFPDGIDQQSLQKQALTKDLEGKFKNNHKAILESIDYLENNPALKQTLRLEGTNYILNSFNVNSIGLRWVEFLNEFKN